MFVEGMDADSCRPPPHCFSSSPAAAQVHSQGYGKSRSAFCCVGGGAGRGGAFLPRSEEYTGRTVGQKGTTSGVRALQRSQGRVPGHFQLCCWLQRMPQNLVPSRGPPGWGSPCGWSWGTWAPVPLSSMAGAPACQRGASQPSPGKGNSSPKSLGRPTSSPAMHREQPRTTPDHLGPVLTSVRRKGG